MRDKLTLALLVVLTWSSPSRALEDPRAGIPGGGAVLGSRLDADNVDATGDTAGRGARRDVAPAEAARHPRGRAGTLGEGASFMVIGMSVTFLFLFVLVVCMHGMHRFLVFFDRFFPETTPGSTNSARRESTDDQVALAIAIARARRKE